MHDHARVDDSARPRGRMPRTAAQRALLKQSQLLARLWGTAREIFAEERGTLTEELMSIEAEREARDAERDEFWRRAVEVEACVAQLGSRVEDIELNLEAAKRVTQKHVKEARDAREATQTMLVSAGQPAEK